MNKNFLIPDMHVQLGESWQRQMTLAIVRGPKAEQRNITSWP